MSNKLGDSTIFSYFNYDVIHLILQTKIIAKSRVPLIRSFILVVHVQPISLYHICLCVGQQQQQRSQSMGRGRGRGGGSAGRDLIGQTVRISQGPYKGRCCLCIGSFTKLVEGIHFLQFYFRIVSFSKIYPLKKVCLFIFLIF